MPANTEKLNTVFQAASQEMYAQQEQAGGQAGPEANAEGGEDEVTDVDFEEVDEVEEK